MSFELIFTSSERGLKPGTRGFTTVAMTQGMPVHCVQLCESLSGYVHVYDLNTQEYNRNPVAWSHYRLKCGGRQYSVLSRVASHPKDYTGRTNKIAHHMMLEVPDETGPLAAGPAALLAHPGLFQQQWLGDPRYLPARNRFQTKEESRSFKAEMWERHGLKAEWAAVVARAVWQDPVVPVFLIFDPSLGHDPEALIADALRLLPPARRWAVTFCSYLTALPAGAECHIRGCLAGSDAAFRAARMPNAVVFDLANATRTGTDSLPASDQRLAIAATSGKPPLWKEKADTPVGTSPTTGPQEPTVRSAAASSASPVKGRSGRPSQRIVAPPVGVGGRGMGARPSDTKRRIGIAMIALLAIVAAVVVLREISASQKSPSEPQQAQPEAGTDVPQPASSKQAETTMTNLITAHPPESAPVADNVGQKDTKRSTKAGEPKYDAERETAASRPPKPAIAVVPKPEVRIALVPKDGVKTDKGDRYWLFRQDGHSGDWTTNALKRARSNLKLEIGKNTETVGDFTNERLKFRFSREIPILATECPDGRNLTYYLQTNCFPVITARCIRAESYRFPLGGLAAFITNISAKVTIHLTIGDDCRQVTSSSIHGAEVDLGLAVKEERARLSSAQDKKLADTLRPYQDLSRAIDAALPGYRKLSKQPKHDDSQREKMSQMKQDLKVAVQQACQMEDVVRVFSNNRNKYCSIVLSGINERVRKSTEDDKVRKAKSDLLSIQGDTGNLNFAIQPCIVGLFDYDFDFQPMEWSEAVEARLRERIEEITKEHKRNQPDRIPIKVTLSVPSVGPIAVYSIIE